MHKYTICASYCSDVLRDTIFLLFFRYNQLTIKLKNLICFVRPWVVGVPVTVMPSPVPVDPDSVDGALLSVFKGPVYDTDRHGRPLRHGGYWEQALDRC